MVWGGIGAGKTTLLNALFRKDKTVIKTQMIEYDGQAIDTPGEYSETGRLRRHLMSTAADAQLLLVAQDATRTDSFVPANYFLMFRQPVLGVVTKIDAPSARPDQAIAILRHIGVTGEIFCVSSHSGEGIDALKSALDERKAKWLTQAVVKHSD